MSMLIRQFAIAFVAFAAAIPVQGGGQQLRAGDSAAGEAATLADMVAAIDFINFPRPTTSNWFEADELSTSFWVQGTLADGAIFVNEAMKDLEWKPVEPIATMDADSTWLSLLFEKKGFVVEAQLQTKGQTAKIYLRNAGNIDARRLPVPVGARNMNQHFSGISFDLEGDGPSVEASVRKLLESAGWIGLPQPGPSNNRLVRQGLECTIQSYQSEDKAFQTVAVSVIPRSAFDPADIVAALCPQENGGFSSIEKAQAAIDLGRLPRWQNADATSQSGLLLEYKVSGNAANIVQHYRELLEPQGWKMVGPATSLVDRANVCWRNGGFLLNLQIQETGKKNVTNLVRVFNLGDGDVRMLPFPEGVELRPHATLSNNQSITAHSRLSGNELSDFYREKLAALDWQESQDLQFSKGDWRARIYLGSESFGMTQYHISLWLNDEEDDKEENDN